MNSIRIDAKVIDHQEPAGWYQAKLYGCSLSIIDSSEEERYASGYTQAGPGTLLVFSVAGGDADFDFADYWILQVDPQQPPRTLGGGDQGYPHGYLRGSWEVLAHGRGSARAARLKNWWTEWAPAHGGQTAVMARWLGEQLRQGQEQPAGPAPQATGDEQRFYPLEAWSFQ